MNFIKCCVLIKCVLDKLMSELPYKKIILWCRTTTTLKYWKDKFSLDYTNFEFFKTDCYTDQDYRSLNKFYESKGLSMLFCCGRCRGGSDVQFVDCGIHLDDVKTRSTNVSLQSDGRIMRPDKEKNKKRAHIIESYVLDQDNTANLLTIQKVTKYYSEILNMNNKKDWNNNYEEILKLFNNTEINIEKNEFVINIDNNKEHNMIIKFTAKSIDWNDIKNMLIDVIIKNAAVDPMDKLKKEYMFDREQNKSLNIMSSKTYLELMKEGGLRNNPKEYYGSIWINW